MNQTNQIDKEREELCKISEASVYFCNGVEYRTFVMDKLYSFFQQSKKKAVEDFKKEVLEKVEEGTFIKRFLKEVTSNIKKEKK